MTNKQTNKQNKFTTLTLENECDNKHMQNTKSFDKNIKNERP